MALVTVSGFPCVGKTKRSQELKAYFEDKLKAGEGGPITAVTIVDDESVHVTRASYDGEYRRGAMSSSKRRAKCPTPRLWRTAM